MYRTKEILAGKFKTVVTHKGTNNLQLHPVLKNQRIMPVEIGPW